VEGDRTVRELPSGSGIRLVAADEDVNVIATWIEGST